MREAGVKEKGQAKTIRIVPRGAPLAKPAWIRVRAPSPNSRFYEIKDILRRQRLHTVCEEASAISARGAARSAMWRMGARWHRMLTSRGTWPRRSPRCGSTTS
jgi:hypothetical protein